MKRTNIIPCKPLLPEVVKESPPVLINEISQLLKLKMKENENQVTQDSARLLILNLAQRDGVTQLDLVKATHLKPPTVSVTLKKLADLGFITRANDKSDLRAVRVYLTDKGRELDRDSFRRIALADNLLMKGITENESRVLVALLTKMRDNLLAPESGEES
jgi:DNA-binding MarR family transcriptional regulator